MPTTVEQIRQDYREAVASAIEGQDNLEAWNRVRLSLENAILCAWVSAAVKTSEGIPECDLAKMLYAKEGCGAGAEGSKGFQPGNTCAGDGDGQAESGESSHQTSTPEFKSLSKSELHDLTTDELMSEIERLEKDENLDAFPWEDITDDQLGAIGKALKKRRNKPELGVNPLGRAKKLKDWMAPTWDYRGWLIEEQPWDEDDPSLGKAWKITPDREGYTREDSGLTDAQHNFFVDVHEEDVQRSQSFREAKIWIDELRNSYETGEYDEMSDQHQEDREDIDTAYNTGNIDPNDPKMTHKRTFAKKDAFDEMFDLFDIEPSFEVGVNVAALDDLAGRVPMVRSAVDQMEAMAKSLAEEIIVSERAGVLPFMESTSKGVQAALKNVFWVSDVDHNVVVNIQHLLADAIRGVMPDKALSLPEFINHAKLEGAANLTDARLETIFRTNVSTAANEGVMAVLRDPVAVDLFPLAMITEIEDDRSRPHHAAMDGYISTPGEIDRLHLRPPNGYNCRGSLIKIAWDEANDLGLLDDTGKPDMIALKRHNSPEQEGLIAAGTYPDEGFKRGGFGR